MRLRRRSALRCSYTSRNPVSQCVAVVAVCCSASWCVAVCCSIVLFAHFWEPCVAVYCSMLQCIAVRHSLLQCIVALHCSYTSRNPVSQCVAVCCNSPTGDCTNTPINSMQVIRDIAHLHTLCSSRVSHIIYSIYTSLLTYSNVSLYQYTNTPYSVDPRQCSSTHTILI